MELAYTRTGKGEPVVLIHGIGHRKEGWDRVAKQLAKSFDVIAVDLPGFGESPEMRGDGPITLDRLAGSVSDQFTRWGITRPHVAGNSLGGLIALELGATGQAASVTGLSPSGFNNRSDRRLPWFAIQFTRVESRYTPKVLLRLVTRPKRTRRLALFTMYAHADRLPRKAAAADAIAFGRSPGFTRVVPLTYRHRFTRPVAVPTTIAWGAKDRVYRHGLSKRAAKALPDALHITLADIGHVPMGDDPKKVADIIAATARRTTD